MEGGGRGGRRDQMARKERVAGGQNQEDQGQKRISAEEVMENQTIAASFYGCTEYLNSEICMNLALHSRPINQSIENVPFINGSNKKASLIWRLRG
jgi:hypothetical protein